MALSVKSSFAAGELDPALRERTTFDKYQSGLATARNIIIGKTGRVISRPGRSLFKKTKLSDRQVLIYSPKNSGYLIEWGHLYVRVYDFDGNLVGTERSHSLTEDDLPNIRFETTGVYVYIFCDGKILRKLNFTTCTFVSSILNIPTNPIYASSTITGTGYDLDYLFTMVINGEEGLQPLVNGVGKLPINAGESNILVVDLSIFGVIPNFTEMRVYRRPRNGGAFGFVGSSTYTNLSGSTFSCTFIDNGEVADYTHNPPSSVIGSDTTHDYAINLLSKLGIIYQQRLLLTSGLNTTISSGLNREAIYASRPGFQDDFYRDYPLNDASALLFKSGTSGHAQVLRMLDNDGLVVFTTVGIFLSGGQLGPSNLSLTKKGNWVIDENVPPLAVPGGALFIDLSTNTVRQLSWSTEAASYSGTELSTFSNHLFVGKRVVSWDFQEGDVPCLWVVFDDGTFASFTYEPEQAMRAWTRHDSIVNVEAVAGTGYANKTFFLIEKDGERYIELTVPRYISGATLASDSEADKGHSIAAMDSMLSFRTLLNDSFVGTDNFTITPVTTDVWDGPLRITTGGSNIFPSPGIGDVGTIIRFFDTDETSIDLEVISWVGPRDITVQPSALFPSSAALTARLYKTTNVLTGLDHLEGEYPSVIVDGNVICSPNNDDQNYHAVQVVSGSLTLPNDMLGAIIHVGRPITFDMETLDIDTVEQRPTLIESKTVNKLYLKTYNSRGLYVNNTFPNNDKVDGMQDIDSISVDYTEDNPIIGNTYQKPKTNRYEVILPGDWKSQGRVCIRQVDPLHFEILSIIPDLEDMRR